MSVSDRSPPWSDYQRAVKQITQQVGVTNELEFPCLLLQLYPIVSSSKLTLGQLKELKRQIWMSDLLHVMVEILRQDFSVIEGTWNTAQKVAYVLASVTSSLHPTEEKAEQMKEFYDILLPTVVDSTLILATNMLEAITNGTHKSVDTFTNVLDSLTEVCSSHYSLVLRVLQSPYLLHMLISDHCDVAYKTLTALDALLNIDTSSIQGLPLETFNSIVDELVYKISGSHKKIAFQSVEVLATIASRDSNILDLVATRYTGLQTIISKWGFSNLKVPTQLFIEQINSIPAVNKETQAAIVIQASWRGYTMRKKMKRVHSGLRRFQQLYRKWKTQKEEAEKAERKKKEAEIANQKLMKKEKIAFWESQLKLMEQLPSGKMPVFIMQQKAKAATKIQSYWRTYIVKKKCSHLRQNILLRKSAITIQRAFRKHAQKRSANHASAHCISEKEAFQSEINNFRMARGQKHMSATETKDQHKQVQSLLEKFYLSRPTQSRQSNQHKIILSQLKRSSSLLASAPSLIEAFSNQSVTNWFCSSSNQITTMARVAHKEELKSFSLPWWKRSS